MYECLSLVVGFLTLGVLFTTLVVLKGYARDTKKLADAAVKQLPRPWVVLKRSADPSTRTALEETEVSLADQPHLIFENVGTGPAVNCRYHVKDTGKEERGTTSWQLPEIGPASNFESNYPTNALPGNAVVIIEYESVAGSHYRTEMTIDNRKWVPKIRFSSLRSKIGNS